MMIFSFRFIKFFCLILLITSLNSCSNKIKVSIATASIANTTPQWLSRAGNETLIINGVFPEINFFVTIDGQLCSSLKRISSTKLSCLTPANTEIKRANVEIKFVNVVLAKKEIKYVGILGQSSSNNVIQKARALSLPLMLKSLNSRLYIGDYGNRRIVGFNNSTNITERDFDFVIGAPHLQVSGDYNPLSLGRFKVRDFDYANGLFMFADGENNRVLIFEGIPSATNPNPKIVLGQPDATTSLVNNGGISAKSLNQPMSAKFIDGKIYVADQNNNRILIWNSVPTENFKAADTVIGQTSFTTAVTGITATNFNGPWFIEKIGTKFFVSDFVNARVMVWNSVPTANTAADRVIGQASLTTKSTTASATILLAPAVIKYHAPNLYISDYNGNRVMVYKNFDPTAAVTNGLAADIVLGQPNFSTTALWTESSLISAKSLNKPYGIEIFDGKLYIADTYNYRILIYDHIPTDVINDQHQAANGVIGQPGFTLGSGTRASHEARFTPFPSGVIYFNGKLLINSESHGRISGWNGIPTEDFAPADFVLGQDGFAATQISGNRGLANPTASTLTVPYQLLNHNNKLYVSDALNNRVLIWNSLTGTNGQAADHVFGQSSFTTKVATPISLASMNTPIGMDIVDDKLIVADRGNHRFLVYDTVPASDFVSADDVIGQSNDSSGGANRTSTPSTISASGFNSPMTSASWQGKYLVADHVNRRILLWNSLDSFLAKEPASAIWGQDSFTTVDITSTLGLNRGNTYMSVRVIDDTLYVVDPYGNRILIFENPPVGSLLVPASVIGQKDFVTNTRLFDENFSAESFQTVVGIFGIEDTIFITDYSNHRVIIIPK